MCCKKPLRPPNMPCPYREHCSSLGVAKFAPIVSWGARVPPATRQTPSLHGGLPPPPRPPHLRSASGLPIKRQYKTKPITKPINRDARGREPMRGVWAVGAGSHPTINRPLPEHHRCKLSRPSQISLVTVGSHPPRSRVLSNKFHHQMPSVRKRSSSPMEVLTTDNFGKLLDPTVSEAQRQA